MRYGKIAFFVDKQVKTVVFNMNFIEAVSEWAHKLSVSPKRGIAAFLIADRIQRIIDCLNADQKRRVVSGADAAHAV